MEDGPDIDVDLGRPPQRTADLLARIAAILQVDPSFFLRSPDCGSRSEPSDTAGELGELLRLFHAIEDPDTRRAALNLVRLLQIRDREA